MHKVKLKFKAVTVIILPDIYLHSIQVFHLRPPRSPTPPPEFVTPSNSPQTDSQVRQITEGLINCSIFLSSECRPGEHGPAGDSDRGQDVRSGEVLRGVARSHQQRAHACAMVRGGA